MNDGYICIKQQKLRHWKKAILLTRSAYFAAVGMAVPAANISEEINSLLWVAPMVVMVAGVVTLF